MTDLRSSIPARGLLLHVFPPLSHTLLSLPLYNKKGKTSKTNPKKIESLIEETPMYLSSVWMVAG
jgi:hypothetical protein